MYNHLRTLLLNRAAVEPATHPASELVPAAFQSIALPAYLKGIRALLFGSNPDVDMLNYRLAQYMPLLHCTELEEYVLAMDSRITYPTSQAGDLVPAAQFSPMIDTATIDVSADIAGNLLAEGGYVLTTEAEDEFYHELSDIASQGRYVLLLAENSLVLDVENGLQLRLEMPASQDPLVLGGSPALPDMGGKMRYIFDVEIGYGEVLLRQFAPVPARQWVIPLVYTDGLSQPMNFPGTGYIFAVSQTNGANYFAFEGYLRPQWSLGQIAALLQGSSEDSMLQLFGGQSPPEPWATFRNLWYSHPETAYQLGGLLLALAYRTEEVRVGHGT